MCVVLKVSSSQLIIVCTFLEQGSGRMRIHTLLLSLATFIVSIILRVIDKVCVHFVDKEHGYYR